MHLRKRKGLPPDEDETKLVQCGEKERSVGRGRSAIGVALSPR